MLSWEFETWWVFNLAIQIVTLSRVLLREHRTPASRIAWMVLILAVPLAGVILYFLFGEINFGRRSVARMKTVLGSLPKRPAGSSQADDLVNIPVIFRQSFARAKAVNGFAASDGNTGQLMASAGYTAKQFLDDIDQAQDHIHLLFYIWLNDTIGTQVIEAVKRAALRGVTVRCLVDGMGSRVLVNSKDWHEMRECGVKLGVAFSLRFFLLHIFFGRIDIRNHRKIVVIDNAITYCGSQNCADPAFEIKPKFAPWVDIVVRLTGPVVWQNQNVFIGDWTTHTGENIAELLAEPVPAFTGGFPAIVIGTGPNENYQAVPDIFQNLISSAQKQVLITTPYYVPSESLHRRICSTALRGIDVKLIVPKYNDSAVVARASKSYFRSLLHCGVELYEYRPGLLHSKILTIDGQAALIGSANLDRRSFDLNFENCMLFVDPDLAGDLQHRQMEYIADSDVTLLADVNNWSFRNRMANNLVATMGPLL